MKPASMTNEELIAAYNSQADVEREKNVDAFIENTLDFISGVAQGGTFNLGDELYAGTQALGKYIGSGGSSDFITDYQRAWEGEQVRLNMVSERSPVASTAGELAAMAPFFGKIAATKAPALTKAAMYFTVGGTSGFGSGDGMTGRLQTGVANGTLAAIGGALPGNSEVAGKMSMNVIRRIANIVVPKNKAINQGLQGITTAMAKNPVKAGLALSAGGALTGQPLTAAVGLGAAGMAGIKQAAAKYPAVEGLIAQGAYETNRLRREADYGNMSDDELLEQYYESLTDDELRQLYNEGQL